jgi:hypothetical protein
MIQIQTAGCPPAAEQFIESEEWKISADPSPLS